MKNQYNRLNATTFNLLSYRRCVLNAYNDIDSGELNHKGFNRVLQFAKNHDNDKQIKAIDRQFIINIFWEYGGRGNIDNIDRKDILNELNKLLLIIQKNITNNQ